MKKLNITIIAGLLVAVLGATLVFAYGRNVDQRIASGRELVDVVVATKTLAAGTATDALGGSVRIDRVPREYVADGALRSLDGLPNVVLRGPVAKGGQLTADSFGSPENAPLVQPKPGNIALAIEVGLSPGVARYVTPGSAVDIFVTFAGGGGDTSGGTAGTSSLTDRRTKLFASGIKVLSVSVAPPQLPAGTDAETAQAQETPSSLVIAVIDVSPTEAERIVNAATLGKLYLGLSTTGETHKTSTGATPNDVINANR